MTRNPGLSYFLFPISYFISHISYLISHISYLISHISYLISHISYLIFHISYFIFPISYLIFHISLCLSRHALLSGCAAAERCWSCKFQGSFASLTPSHKQRRSREKWAESPDHPADFKESNYLKCMYARIRGNRSAWAGRTRTWV